MHIAALLATRICAIAADVLVLLTTWRQTAGSDLTLWRVFSMESGGLFLHLLLRDGKWAFFEIRCNQAAYMSFPGALYFMCVSQ